MSLFYKQIYRCKKCGETYKELPTYCNCGTQLSFICPCNMWSAIPKFQPTTYCEEIKKNIFSFGKKKKVDELEYKMHYLENELLKSNEETKELRKEKLENDIEIQKLQYKIMDLEREKLNLEMINSGLSRLVEQYKQMRNLESKAAIPKETIEAVKYAMKHAHPDNGGNAEDFIKFKKCYEELTKN